MVDRISTGQEQENQMSTLIMIPVDLDLIQSKKKFQLLVVLRPPFWSSSRKGSGWHVRGCQCIGQGQGDMLGGGVRGDGVGYTPKSSCRTFMPLFFYHLWQLMNMIPSDLFALPAFRATVPRTETKDGERPFSPKSFPSSLFPVLK